MASTISNQKTIKTWYDYKTRTFESFIIARIIYYWLILDWIVENNDLFATRRVFIGLSNNCLVRIIANTS